ncbi:MAG: universal stress protein [Dissulfurispiraceae bacterium]
MEADVDVTALLTQQLQEKFTGLKERAKDIHITVNIMVGHAAEQIMKYVSDNNCDMLVMGQVGISAIEAFLLGSVASRVATNAPCTVTLVK